MTIKIIEPLAIKEPTAEYRVERKKNDIAWKDVLDAFLPDFFRLCLPKLAKLIDWSKSFESLDNELHAITKDFLTGTKIVDKLFKVYLLNGKIQKVLLHLEIQGEPEEDFPERMFICSSRSFDKYRQPIISCAVLTDSQKNWRPNTFKVGLVGYGLSLKYHIIKLTDYETKRNELEKSENPFASVILVYLDALKAKKQSPMKQLHIKLALTRRLYKKGFSKPQAVVLYYFIDWLIAMPREFEVKYLKQVRELEENSNMSYVSNAELFGIEKGILQGISQGRQEGEAALLIRQLTRKFGPLAEKHLQKIHHADAGILLIWGEKILDAKTLEEIFN